MAVQQKAAGAGVTCDVMRNIGLAAHSDCLDVRSAETFADVRRLLAVELEHVQWYVGQYFAYKCRFRIQEYPNPSHKRRHRRADAARCVRRNSTRAGRIEDKADGIGARSGRRECVFCPGNATN